MLCLLYIIIIVREVLSMKISYKKLWVMLGTMTKLNKGEEVSLSTLLRICDYFDCNIGDICDAVKAKNLHKVEVE